MENKGYHKANKRKHSKGHKQISIIEENFPKSID